ncbi:hypothetical protein P4L01_30310 [Bacillus cereus]|nr:hypothetical protein [Bacillus cereus]MEC2467403.1 hypothetical protein [Bacillus cereus]
MNLPICNEKEVNVLTKILRYQKNDKSNKMKIHREYLEDRGWTYDDLFHGDSGVYVTYKKEVVKRNKIILV